MKSSPPSPSQSHPRNAMTAWILWSGTSGRTSPSSPTQPASGSEQPIATTGHLHGRHPPTGWLFKRIFILPFWFVSPSLTLSSPFPVPSSVPLKFTSVVPAALASNLPFWWRDCPPPTPARAAGRTERFRFLINTGPSEGEARTPGPAGFLAGAPCRSLATLLLCMKLPLVGRPPSGQHPVPPSQPVA